jgi:ribokinase
VAARAAASGLLALGPKSAVVTVGADGAVFTVGEDAGHVPAPEADVVDTTGAGDAFVGALALWLARGASLDEAVGYAVRAGSAAVTREGAQGALPTPDVLEAP